MEQKIPILKAIMMPRDTNIWGTVFGGVIINHLDEASGIEAIMHTDKPKVVTKAVKEIIFEAPALVGDLISFYTTVIRKGKTSITVGVEAIAQRRGSDKDLKIAQAEFTYVAVDEKGNKALLIG